MGDRDRPADRLALPGAQSASAIVDAQYWRALAMCYGRRAGGPRWRARRGAATARNRRRSGGGRPRGTSRAVATRCRPRERTWRQPQARADLMRTYASKIVRVPAATSSGQSRLRLLQSPPWTDVLDRLETQISGSARIIGWGPSSLQGTASALARAHSRLLVALESRSTVGEDVVLQLASEAVELLLAVARVWGLGRPDVTELLPRS